MSMPRKKGAEFMISFVQEYLDGDMERIFFDADFNHYMIQHYPSMERHDAELAECFAFYLGEQGVDCSLGLSDAEHKRLIRKQFDNFLDAARDGLT